MLQVRKKTALRIVAILIVLVMLCGCSNVPGGTASSDAPEDKTEAVAKTEESEEDEDESKESDKDEEGAASEEEDYWEGPDENIYDGGPDFTSLATQFNGIFRNLTIEEAAEKYAITLVDGGKYAGYEGDIGDIIPEYKDIDLDGDRKTDVIRREGAHYVIECTSAGSFETHDFSTSPNEGEIIEFEDTVCRNIDEILVAHYTFGTGGPVVWDTSVYSYQKGKWNEYPLIDDNGINSKDLQIYIAKRTGANYEPGAVRVAAADMTTLLLDFGHKDGPDQTYDYEAEYLFWSFSPDHVNERSDYGCYGGSDYTLLLNKWPLEVSGEPVELTGSLQYDLNLFMSNFSEQNFRQEPWIPALAHFALEWQKINKSLKPVEAGGRTCYRITHSDMNGILAKYFDTNLEEGELAECDIDNDFGGYLDYESEDGIYYCEPAADGDMYAHNAFTVVTGAESIGDGSYLRLHFKVYRENTDDYDDHGIGKEQYSLDADKAADLAKRGELVEAYDGTAIVINYNEGYGLYEYSVQ